MLFHGELELADDAESRLPVTLTMESESLSLATGDEKLGTWNRPEAKAVEIARGRYDLTLGNETLIFTPENGQLFASRGLPYFNEPDSEPEEPAGFLAKIKKWGVRPTDYASSPGRAEDEAELSSGSVDLPAGPLDAAVADHQASTTPPAPSPSLQAAYADAVRGVPTGNPDPATKQPVMARPLAAAAAPMPVAPSPSRLDGPTLRRSAEPARSKEPTPVAGPLATTTADPIQPNPKGVPQQQDPPRPDPPRPESGATIHMTTGAPPAPAVAPIEVGSGRGTGPTHVVAPHLPDVAGLLTRLDAALRDLQEGRMEPDRGRAMAEVVRAMCRAIEVSGGGANDLNRIADKLDEGNGLGDDAIEDEV